MAVIDANELFSALGLAAAEGADLPEGGMSGATLLEGLTTSGAPVIVKVIELSSPDQAGQGRRELFAYTELSRRIAIPSPRMVAAHETEDWIAIALERHEPAEPAQAWTTAQWTDLAGLLGRMHRTSRGVRSVTPPLDLQRRHERDGPDSFARRLWSAPDDENRLKRVADDLTHLRAAVDESPHSFVHGDCHLGNVVRTSTGRPLLVDWASARVGPSVGDISFALTRAAASADTVPRHPAMDAYSSAAGVDADQTRRAATAHQLLILVEQYPEFADFLAPRDVDRLRRTFDALLREWVGRS
ncbi:phosphotransferase enzyme family protein [Parenemella sanctibonifatiensis]|uniref:Aminoglycoside phosphotransferase domain-containing protein n=1 Tax=Parenemella sanctibonifatiensis TaxID=2016505 RepID=A0A255EIU0_9ACTN|nr:aminoglycoside phosphotransferase family protein [Parenemella sanctibonifatiensis]OYN89352.1 hypothetical protein CGZ91_10635 [Parenemella sanctibonifatiensis]